MASVGREFWFNVEQLKSQLLMAQTIENLPELPKEQQPANIVRIKPCSREEVIEKLEKLTEVVVTAIMKNDPPCFQFNSRTTWKNIKFADSVGLEMLDNVCLSKVKFDSYSSITKFAAILQVIAISHNLLQEDKFATKRDIYYSDVMFFGSQSVVDEIVETIACMVKVPRHSLHVLATSKGLIAGELRYREYDGTYVDCRFRTSGVVVSSHVAGISELYSDAKMVLIVEKEATFQRLMNDSILQKLNPCIIITGKGYPDVNTRMMVRKLWTTLNIPILGLIDADPHGIEILSVYKYGSKALSFDAHHLTVPTIKWLGVLPSDIERLSVSEHVRIPLSANDKRKCEALLNKPFIKSQPAWKKEVEVLLTRGYKAEIQALSTVSGNFLTDTYITVKIRNGRWL